MAVCFTRFIGRHLFEHSGRGASQGPKAGESSLVEVCFGGKKWGQMGIFLKRGGMAPYPPVSPQLNTPIQLRVKRVIKVREKRSLDVYLDNNLHIQNV